MFEIQKVELEADEESERGHAGREVWVKQQPFEWHGRLSELDSGVLRGFWAEARAYARWEIGRYACWRGQDEPVLADGYDAEGIVQAAFEKLLSWEAKNVPIIYSAEELRRELWNLIRHRVRWLHERSETGRVVSEWDVLVAEAEGEEVSVFDALPGQIAAPDQQVWDREKEEGLAEFKDGFEQALGKRRALVRLFRGVWSGKKQRELAAGFGGKVSRVRALRGQLTRKLARFGVQARGGVAEVIRGVAD